MKIAVNHIIIDVAYNYNIYNNKWEELENIMRL